MSAISWGAIGDWRFVIGDPSLLPHCMPCAVCLTLSPFSLPPTLFSFTFSHTFTFTHTFTFFLSPPDTFRCRSRHLLAVLLSLSHSFSHYFLHFHLHFSSHILISSFPFSTTQLMSSVRFACATPTALSYFKLACLQLFPNFPSPPPFFRKFPPIPLRSYWL